MFHLQWNRHLRWFSLIKCLPAQNAAGTPTVLDDLPKFGNLDSPPQQTTLSGDLNSLHLRSDGLQVYANTHAHR